MWGTVTGTADLNITTNGKILEDTYSGFVIPSYTSEEIKQMWEAEYDKNSKFSREVISKGNFEVTLVKYGFFEHYDISNDNKTDFRADIKVKNIGSELHCYDVDNAKIISGSNEYSESLYSNFGIWNNCIEAGFVQEGYIVYDNVPQNLTGQIKINVGADEFNNKNDFYEFTVTL
jgi:hypothetical protein